MCIRDSNQETFILDCIEELPENIEIKAFKTRRVDSHTLEVEVEKGQHINDVFSALDDGGIHISSMRNRANRLEEMFVNLIDGAV